ncbi:hypothetical protein PIB30_010278 [Stylosanthes scabra]|uniref:Uncharacterized protein n=1 Tax=Stylosanthes scabra TaxID=79078 RepID=A0ABU6T6X9_9FABA|nr:hypothetical protein [Stylosanthes scabra]
MIPTTSDSPRVLSRSRQSSDPRYHLDSRARRDNPKAFPKSPNSRLCFQALKAKCYPIQAQSLNVTCACAAKVWKA